MKRVFLFVTCALLLCAEPICCDAFSFGNWFKKKNDTSKSAPAPKKTPYEKFIEKDGVQKSVGFATLYKSGNDIYMEIPDSLMGRSIVLTSMIRECSDPRLSIGDDISSRRVYILDKTDSLFLFQREGPKRIVDKCDTSMIDALKLSRAMTNSLVLPIEYRNTDSTASVVKVNALFNPSSKEVIQFKSIKYKDNNVVGAKFGKAGDNILEISSSDKYVAVSRSFSLKPIIQSFLGDAYEGDGMCGKLCIRYSLLEESTLPMKKYDSRMGVRHSTFQEMSSDKPSSSHDYVCRWDFRGDNKLIFYVDTLLTGVYSKSVYDAINAWSNVLNEIGLNGKLEARSLEHGIDILDPNVSCVLLNATSAETPSSWIYCPDKMQFRSCHINIPSGINMGIYRKVTSRIGDTDKRFLSDKLEDDAVYEYLYAHLLYQEGRCLGLVSNPVASTIYSADQLKSPEFTRDNGISLSAMVPSYVNIYPSLQDVKQGAVTLLDRVGEWDKYTLSWLYDVPSFEYRDDVIYLGSHPTQIDYRLINDPYGYKNCIGNEPKAYCDAVFEHSKALLCDAVEMLEKTDNQLLQELFVDFVWMNMFYSVSYPTAFVGGMRTSELRQGSECAKYEALPVNVQRNALEVSFRQLDRLQELNAYCRPIITIAGANVDFSKLNLQNKFMNLNMNVVLPRLEMARLFGGSGFSVEEYIDRVVDYMMKGVSKGDYKSIECMPIMIMINYFASMNNVCKSRLSRALDPKSANSFSTQINSGESGISLEYTEMYPIWGVRALELVDFKLDEAIKYAKNKKIVSELKYISYLVKSSLGK